MISTVMYLSRRFTFMAYTISLENRTYKTLNEEYTITEERQKTDNTIKIRFNIAATGSNQEKTTDWMNMPLSDPIGVIKKVMPTIIDNLPLIESNDKNRGFVCSTFLLRGGKEIKLYLPIAETTKQLMNLIERHDKTQLSDGERIYNVNYKEIEALIIN